MSKDTLVSVKLLNVISNSTSAIIQVGDRDYSYLYNQEMSIERNITVYGADEPYFERYPLFTKPLPNLLSMLLPGTVEHTMLSKLVPLPQQMPTIEVDSIKVTSNSQSANIQLGNGRKLIAENRAKTFEQYIFPTKKRDADH